MLCFDWDLFVHVCESPKDALQIGIQNLEISNFFSTLHSFRILY